MNSMSSSPWKHIYLLLIICFWGGGPLRSLAQDEPTDSLKAVFEQTADRNQRLRTLNELVNYYRANQYDSALAWSFRLIEEAETSLATDIDTFEVGLAYLQQAKTYLLRKELSLSEQAYERAEQFFRLAGYNYQLAEIYIDLGQIQFKRGNIESAIFQYHQARSLAFRFWTRYVERKDEQRRLIYESQLAHAYYALADLFIEIAQPDSGLHYLAQSAKLYRELDDGWGIGNCLYTRAQYYRDHTADYSAAFRDLMEALTLYEALDNAYNVSFITGEIGNLFRAAGNYEKADDYYQEALDKAKEVQDRELIAQQHLHIGELHLAMDDPMNALISGHAAQAELQAFPYPDLLILSHFLLGTAHRQTCAADSARFYLESVISVGSATENWQEVSKAWKMLAEVLLACQQQSGPAEIALQTAIELADAHRLPREVIDARLQLGKLLTQDQQFDRALQMLTTTQREAQAAGLSEANLDAYQALSLLYILSNQPAEAAASVKAYDQMREHINKQSNRESFELSYEVSHLQTVNKTLSNENEKQELKLRISRITYQALGGVVALIAVLALVLYISRNQLQAKNKLITFYNQEARHRTQNNLQMLENLMHLQLGRLQNPRAKEALGSAISRVEAISNLVKQFYDPVDSSNRDHEKLDLRSYLDKRIDELFHVAGINSAHITITKEIEAIETGIDTALPLGLIVNECLTNAIKYAIPYSEHPELALTLVSRDDGQIQLTISDNGPGIPIDTESLRPGSFGLSLVRTLVRKLKGTLTIDTKSGTRLSIVFPRG